MADALSGRQSLVADHSIADRCEDDFEDDIRDRIEFVPMDRV